MRCLSYFCSQLVLLQTRFLRILLIVICFNMSRNAWPMDLLISFFLLSVNIAMTSLIFYSS